MARSAEHVLAIQELRRTGAGALQDTPIRFEWDPGTHSSPKAGIDLSLLVRTTREEPAGSDRPVEQVLSATWQPFEISGEWVDSWAGEGFAMRTFEEFAKLVSRAPLVRLDLDELSFTGLLTELKSTYTHARRIKYQCTFSPHFYGTGKDLRSAKIVPPVAVPMASYVQQVVEALAEARKTHTQAATLPFSENTHERVGARLKAVEVEVAQFNRDPSGPVAADVGDARTLLSQFRAVQGQAQRLLESAATARGELDLAVVDAINILTLDQWARDLGRYARLIVLRSNDGALAALAHAAETPARYYRPYAGESVYSVARRFYGTAQDWRRIQQANHLSKLRFDGSENLLIPEAS